MSAHVLIITIIIIMIIIKLTILVLIIIIIVIIMIMMMMIMIMDIIMIMIHRCSILMCTMYISISTRSTLKASNILRSMPSCISPTSD